MLTYTPSNVALLCMLAGLISGCSSLITHEKLPPPEVKPRGQGGTHLNQSILYRTESPIASMFRSLVAYFAFMAGVLATTVAPFTATAPEQYVRFAAAVSFFAFIVGYDPTRFQGLMSMQLPGRSAEKGKQKPYADQLKQSTSIIGLLVILPLWKIVGKAGFHPALSLLICVPVVNVVMIYVFAFTE